MNRLQRWDHWPPLPSPPRFTGVYVASQPGGIHLPTQRFRAIDLFSLGDDELTGHPNQLLYGSVLLKPSSLDAANPAVRSAASFAVDAIKKSRRTTISTSPTVTRALELPLYVTGDNGESEMVVLLEYSDLHRQNQQFKSHVTLGTNFYLTLDDTTFGLRHHVAVALDRDGRHSLFQHTFHAIESAPSSQSSCPAGTSDQQCASGAASPRIMSFNVWNTNPSADVYGYNRRWAQYSKRMDHLVSFVRDAQADVVGFQEVRYDSVLGEDGQHAQIEHLSQRLPEYQFVYQAAMSYINDRTPYERIEEGPAIFSKHPVVSTDYLLLSRDPNNPNDAHQRLCLHAVIDYPGWGLIDVYVTHLSLSEESREQTMLDIWHYMRAGKGVTQVLLGDLNAEPQSRGIQFLRGEADLAGESTDLRDAWLELHAEAPPRSTDDTDKATKFTFPSDNPSKRIDFVLFRGKGAVKSCDIVAQEPTEDTKSYPTDKGMLHPQSPIYASDHRAVIAEFV
ncbi:hypothetical protein P43SY_009145 [Pythium insidiosum]|uniref:Endonuclease/exonuclease/phosphatase domain-containing protein n=1 Tax=Pythium insidiosum TaxID=114742 RepID=A0AAD5LLV1_PYTIN|nr:hypothetical protein P43SY_009145 [Pythium insidiosum]